MPIEPPDALPQSQPSYAIAGTIEPAKLSPAYRAGLAVVAVVMLLLPVFYVGLIVLTGAAVWWHLESNTWLIGGRGGGQLRLLAYVAPAVVGVVVMFFMVKPLLARPAKGRDPIPVSSDDEPALFTFIQQICAQVGSAVPRRVQVDCAVNASAGLLRGVLRRDLVLTIGMPLVAGLTVRQLGGVLAHEFGHFAQRGGMRLTAIVRSTNAWFARVVYERDAWDESLERWSKEADWRLAAVLALARGAVWLSRRVLLGLMWFGHAISCFMLRQMEYDADRYEVGLAGSEAFARTSARLRELGLASQIAYRDLGDGLRTARAIPSDLPAYVAVRARQLPARVTESIAQSPEGKTGFFDTHPTDADRVRAARAIGSDGVLVGGDGPAAELFAHFDALSAAATQHHYEHDLGLEAGSFSLVSVDDAAAESQTRDAGRRAVHAIFGDCLSILRPLALRLPEEPDAPAIASALAAAKARMQELKTEQRAADYRSFEALESRRMDAVTAEALFDAGFHGVDAASFGLQAGTRDAATTAALAAHEEQQALDRTFRAYERAASDCLSCGIALWTRIPRPAQEDAGQDAVDLSSYGTELVAAVNALAGAWSDALEIRRLSYTSTIVAGNEAGSPNPQATQNHLALLATRMVGCVRRIHDSLSGTNVPAIVTRDAISLSAYCGLGPDMPAGQAADAAERVTALYAELLGRVAGFTLEAEASVGAPGIP